MLGSTFVLGLASGSQTLPLINQDAFTSTYRLRVSGKVYQVVIRHSSVNRTGSDGVTQSFDRHNVEATITTLASGATPEYYTKAYFIMEQLPSDTNVEVQDALSDWSIASTNANLVKILGWES